MCPNSPRSIIVVGGGLSGTLVAVHLLSLARASVQVYVIDPSERIGEGVAYRTRHPEHFLNVRVKGMSGVAGDPDHLTRWLSGAGREAAARWGADPDPEAFLPRGLYAEYIHSVLGAAVTAGRATGSTLHHVRGLATDVTRGPGGAAVRVEDGRTVEGARLVLALGNPLPLHPLESEDAFYRSDAYVRDPWSNGALGGTGADAPVLIIGCGLTMIDVTVSLARSGHRGPITAVSRRGLVGHPNAPRSTAAWSIEYDALPRTMRALVRMVREEAARAAGQGVDWRSVIDSLRPHSQRYWRELSPEEQRRFLRHVRAYWEIHRHRTAPINMRDIDAMRASGRLSVRAGRIQGFRPDGHAVSVTFLPRGRSSAETIRVERVINATGPEGDFRRARSPLVDGLLSAGWARPGPYGFGFDATPAGVLLDAKGAPSPFLYGIGPPLRGVLWETLAVPEIREQAGAIARDILGMGGAGE